MVKKLRLVGMSVIAVSTAACGSMAPYGASRTVMRAQTGGEFALEGDRGVAMQKAQAQMAEHCGAGKFNVAKEGEVVVGSTSTSEKGPASGVAIGNTNLFGKEKTNTVSTNVTEWHVWYECAANTPYTAVASIAPASALPVDPAAAPVDSASEATVGKSEASGEPVESAPAASAAPASKHGRGKAKKK